MHVPSPLAFILGARRPISYNCLMTTASISFIAVAIGSVNLRPIISLSFILFVISGCFGGSFSPLANFNWGFHLNGNKKIQGQMFLHNLEVLTLLRHRVSKYIPGNKGVSNLP